jgi:transposase
MADCDLSLIRVFCSMRAGWIRDLRVNLCDSPLSGKWTCPGCVDTPRSTKVRKEWIMERGSRSKRRRFSAEYKAEAVRLVGDSGKSIGAIARELGLGETALRRWVQQAEIDAGRGPTGALTTSEREELGHLRRENQRLRMEREILKKATAFFAKESA